MKLKKLFETLKQCRPNRKEYYIKPIVRFEVDDRHYHFVLIPTITTVPWPYRYNNMACWEIAWLNMRICIGQWKSKDGHFGGERRW